MSNNFIYKPSNDSDFLIHHGIKGQKWGVENGPPYPLNSKEYSALEKKMNGIQKQQTVVNNAARITRNSYSNYGQRGTTDLLNNKLMYQQRTENKFNKSIKDVKNYINKLQNSNLYKDNKDAQKIFKQYSKSIDELVNNTYLLPKAFYDQGVKRQKAINTGTRLFGVPGMGIASAKTNGELTRMLEDPKLLAQWEKYINSINS